MTQVSSELLVRLEHRGLFDISDGQGLAVSCIEGTVWITQSNDPRDIVIDAGQSFLLDKKGLALVAAPAGQATIAVRWPGCDTPFDPIRSSKKASALWNLRGAERREQQ